MIQSGEGYHNLKIWQKARELLLLIYKATEKFPKSEMFVLIPQLKRAMLSVLLNIVEGDRRESRREFLRFLNMADASLIEVEACLEVALDLEFIGKDDFILIESKRRELAAMLSSFIKSVKKSVSL